MKSVNMCLTWIFMQTWFQKWALHFVRFLHGGSPKCLLQTVEKHLTEQCLTIILFKKQLGARYWPRLQKAEGVLPYIRTDFKRWTWEGDERDDNTSAKAEIHSLGENNGQRFMKVKTQNCPTRVTVQHLLIEKRQRTLTPVEYFSSSALSVLEK